MTSIPETLTIDGKRFLVKHTSSIPSGEELLEGVRHHRAMENLAIDRAAAAERIARDLAVMNEATAEAERARDLAKTLIMLRVEGYELVPQDEATTEAIAKQTGGIAFDEIKRVAAGLARVEPGPDAEYFAVMRDDWTTRP